MQPAPIDNSPTQHQQYRTDMGGRAYGRDPPIGPGFRLPDAARQSRMANIARARRLSRPLLDRSSPQSRMPALHDVSRRCAAVLSLLALSACADGGNEDRPQSDVKIAANHHLFGFRSLAGFGTFPVKPEAVTSDRGTLSLTDQSTYTITRSSGTTSPDTYALGEDGALAIYVTGGGREPSVLFRGGYGLTDAGRSDFFFTDRVATQSSPSLGIYYGTRLIPGKAELAGAWHVVSLHTIFAESSALLSPNNVARAAHGGLTIATGDPGTSRTISGTGQESSNATLVFGGTIQNLLGTGSAGDGTCNLSLSYTAGTSATDTRACLAAAGRDLVLALDADETDEESGIVVMLRKFDAPATPAESSRIAGTFIVGGHTLFVNPTNSGSDAFSGTVTLSLQGGFRLDAVGSRGVDFTYTGSWTASQDGSIVITIPATNETWFAAVSRDYATLMLVDDQIENRGNNAPELNLMLGVRQKT
jgi:hypothetical protein